MIWKNLKKKLKLTTATTTTAPIKGKEWEAFGRQMDALRKFAAERTNTRNPKGKVGVLQEIPAVFRKFGEPRFQFRKFEKKPFDNAVGFIQALEKRGYKRLGSGNFSVVLAKGDSKRVIKVTRMQDGWINYAKWAAGIGEAGKFAPKVYSYKKIKGRYSTFYVSVMERLKDTIEDTPEEHQAKLIPELVWRAEKNEMARKFIEMLAPGLLDFLVKMAAEWKIPLANFDLHDGNLMIRTDGSFVVVDPVSRGEDKFDRLKEGDFPLRSRTRFVERRKITLALAI